MFFMDLPDTDLQYQPVVVAQAEQIVAADSGSIRTMGVCLPVPRDKYSLQNAFGPKAYAEYYLRSFEQQNVPFNPPAVLTILEKPKHGALHLITEEDGDTFGSGRKLPGVSRYAYLPDNDYIGDDKAVFLVDLQGIKIKVVFFLQSVEGSYIGDYTFDELCESTGFRWKISSKINSGNKAKVTSINYLDPQVGQYKQLDTGGLEAGLAELDQINYVGKRSIYLASSDLENQGVLLEAALPANEQLFDAIYSQCATLAQTDDTSWKNLNIVGPSSGGLIYFKSRELKYDLSTWRTIVIKFPEHGDLRPLEEEFGSQTGFLFVPNEGYFGPDKMTYILEAEGKRIKVIESVHVGGLPEDGHEGCESGFGIEEIKQTNQSENEGTL